jgi:hypothetical protein
VRGAAFSEDEHRLSEAGEQAYIVTGTYDSATMLDFFALGVCLLLIAVQMFRPR